MTLLTSYSTGTVSVSNSSTTVTGTRTAWLTAGIEAGDIFWAAGLSVRIASVDSNTQITLAYAWPGSAQSGANYEIRFTTDATRVLASSRAVLTTLNNGNLSALSGLTTSADTLAYFTGSGVAALTSFTSAARSLLDDTSVPAMRATLGLGTLATQNASSVAVTGGSITGITDLAIADGGTGSSTAEGARTNLGLGTAAVKNIGTSGDAVPLLSNSNTFSGTITRSPAPGNTEVGAWGFVANSDYAPNFNTHQGRSFGGHLVSTLFGGGSAGVTGWISANDVAGEGVEMELVIGGWGRPATAWYFKEAGTLVAPGAYVNNSDERIKALDDPWEDPIAMLRGLRGRAWTRKDGGGRGIGIIAQDVEAILPDQIYTAVGERVLDDGTVLSEVKSIDTAGVGVAVLVEALKATITRLEAAEAKIAVLEAAQG